MRWWLILLVLGATAHAGPEPVRRPNAVQRALTAIDQTWRHQFASFSIPMTVKISFSPLSIECTIAPTLTNRDPRLDVIKTTAITIK
jgi:hypothetical protein